MSEHVSISTAMSDEELRLARIHDAMNRSGLDPTTTLDLVCGLIEDEFNGDLDEGAPRRFRKLIEEDANVSVEKLQAVILDSKRFPHRNEGDYADRLEWMRRRVRELIEGRLPSHGGSREPLGEQADNVSLTEQYGNSESYTRRRLRRDRPDLLERVDAGELSANKAAIEAGYRDRTLPVRIDKPDSAARSLRNNMEPEALTELRRLLE